MSLQAGFGLAFCIGAVMCSVVGATTIATGLDSTLSALRIASAQFLRSHFWHNMGARHRNTVELRSFGIKAFWLFSRGLQYVVC